MDFVNHAIAETIKTVRERPSSNAATKKSLGEVQELVFDFQSRLLDLQTTALDLQQELAASRQELVAAHEENSQLRADIRSEESRTAKRERYESKKVGTSYVLVPTGESEPYYCPSCGESDQFIPLQPHPRVVKQAIGMTHSCPKCQANYTLA